MRRACLIFFLILLASIGLAQLSDRRYTDAYRAIGNRYLALTRRLVTEDIKLPKTASRKTKLAILAARQESDASRMKEIADALRRLRPPKRFATLQEKTQTFLDLNISQPLTQAKFLRQAIATGRRFNVDALSDHQDRELTESAVAVRNEARRLSFKGSLP